jgi:hypothetical protein
VTTISVAETLKQIIATDPLESLGLHFNIDPPRLDAVTVAAFLKAFLIVSERLRRDIARGSRRLAHALPPDYPQDYARQVLAPDYWPDLPDLTADYLMANPTPKSRMVGSIAGRLRDPTRSCRVSAEWLHLCGGAAN